MKTILCFGDSNTYGSPGHPLEAGGLRHPYEARWTTILQQELGRNHLVIPEGLPGRTTVHDDPIEGAHKNGRRALLASLESHSPIDAVVLMLGTNDLKARFGLSPSDIAAGIGVLLKIIRDYSHEQGTIKTLVVCPPPIFEIGNFAAMFAGGAAKSQELAAAYREIAHLHGAAFLKAGSIIETSRGDGIHFDPPAHLALGHAIAEQIKKTLP